MDELQFAGLTIVDAVARIKRRELSPIDLTREMLRRMDRLNGRLNAFITIMHTSAAEQARHAEEALDRGEDWGALHGVPIAVKDLIDVEGERTTGGSPRFPDRVDQDSDVVTRLKAAGAIIIGKTNLHELAIGVTNNNPHFGAAHNPWNTDYSPGGSSGGSGAAVAASMVPAALGTDTGGSVRIPAAICGISGLRPGKGRLSGQGVLPMSWTLDSVGPMAHTAEDLAILTDVLDARLDSPANCLETLQEPVRWLKIGIPTDPFFWLDTHFEVVGAVRAAIDQLADLGMLVNDLPLNLAEDALRASQVISMGDAAAFHAGRMKDSPEKFGVDVLSRLEWGAKNTAAQYAQARQTGKAWRHRLSEVFQQVDVLALPTTPVAALPLAEGTEAANAARILLKFTYPFSLSYLPSVSIPCGLTSDGLPIGLQLVAPAEKTILRVAHAFQQATDWHTRLPDID
jgi:aspartyl-tRNA(Asn)/glutamyl-tRNA(Gln) amidotransferase subunit A